MTTEIEWTANDLKFISQSKNYFRDNYLSSTRDLSLCIDNYVYAGSMWSSIFNREVPNNIDIFILNSSNETWYIWMRFFSFNNWTEIPAVEVKTPLIDNPIEVSQSTGYENKSYVLNVKKFGRNALVPKNIVLTDCKTPEELIDKFDFDHTKIFYHNTSLKFSREAFVAARDKILSTKISNPSVLSEKRIKKFLDRGFKKGTSEPLLKDVK